DLATVRNPPPEDVQRPRLGDFVYTGAGVCAYPRNPSAGRSSFHGHATSRWHQGSLENLLGLFEGVLALPKFLRLDHGRLDVIERAVGDLLVLAGPDKERARMGDIGVADRARRYAEFQPVVDPTPDVGIRNGDRI